MCVCVHVSYVADGEGNKSERDRSDEIRGAIFFEQLLGVWALFILVSVRRARVYVSTYTHTLECTNLYAHTMFNPHC